MAVERRYQVFVSSTYSDLEDERREIIQALLELDCIPSGMEMFPAANDDQWTLIKRVIDDCDYYLVVIAGRYGSVGAGGLSYTEMEYRYALEIGKPILAFLHKAPANILSGKSETDPAKKESLEAFRTLAQKKLVRFWETPAELGSVVSRSLIKLTKDYPAEGWVRGGAVASVDAREQILELQLKVKQLESELVSSGSVDPKVVGDLARGDDVVTLKLVVSGRGSYYNTESYNYDVEVTWNEIFRQISPTLIDEGTISQIESRLSEYLISQYLREAFREFFAKKSLELSSASLTSEAKDAIVVQFIAIGYVQKGQKKRTVSDRGTYFTLTELGERAMYELRAAKRPTPADLLLDAPHAPTEVLVPDAADDI